MRVFFGIFPNETWLFQCLLVSSIASMILGVVAAFSQKEIRSILSYHVLSQVGYIGGGIALAGLAPERELMVLVLTGVVFYFVHHILVKSALLFSASWILALRSSTQLEKLGGLQHQVPLLSILFAIPAMSLAGLPPFSGFWAKLVLIQSAFYLHQWIYVVAALLAGMLTFLSMLKIWNAAFLGKRPSAGDEVQRDDPAWLLFGGLLVLCTLALSLYPAGLFELSRLAAENLILRNSLGGGV